MTTHHAPSTGPRWFRVLTVALLLPMILSVPPAWALSRSDDLRPKACENLPACAGDVTRAIGADAAPTTAPDKGPTGGAITVTGAALTPDQHAQINAAIQADFAAGRAAEQALDVEALRAGGVKVYVMPGLEPFDDILVAHPGRGGDAFNHQLRQIYLSPRQLAFVQGLSPAAQAQFWAHEIEHLNHPQDVEATIQTRAPITVVTLEVRLRGAREYLAKTRFRLDTLSERKSSLAWSGNFAEGKGGHVSEEHARAWRALSGEEEDADLDVSRAIAAVANLEEELRRAQAAARRTTAGPQPPGAAPTVQSAAVTPFTDLADDLVDQRAQAYVDRREGRPNTFRLPGEITREELTALKAHYGVILGTTTFSGQGIAATKLEMVKAALRQQLRAHVAQGKKVLVVSGATDLGGVKLVYDVADEPEFRGKVDTMGLVAGVGLTSSQKSRASAQPYGIRQTHYLYVEETRVPYDGAKPGDWGAESPVFVDFLTHLVAFGGGDQAASEIKAAASAGKPVTVLLGVPNAAGDLGEAELSYLTYAGRPETAQEIKGRLEAELATASDEARKKALQKQVKAVNRALAFAIPGTPQLTALEVTALAAAPESAASSPATSDQRPATSPAAMDAAAQTAAALAEFKGLEAEAFADDAAGQAMAALKPQTWLIHSDSLRTSDTPNAFLAMREAKRRGSKVNFAIFEPVLREQRAPDGSITGVRLILWSGDGVIDLNASYESESPATRAYRVAAREAHFEDASTLPVAAKSYYIRAAGAALDGPTLQVTEIGIEFTTGAEALRAATRLFLHDEEVGRLAEAAAEARVARFLQRVNAGSQGATAGIETMVQVVPAVALDEAVDIIEDTEMPLTHPVTTIFAPRKVYEHATEIAARKWGEKFRYVALRTIPRVLREGQQRMLVVLDAVPQPATQMRPDASLMRSIATGEVQRHASDLADFAGGPLDELFVAPVPKRVEQDGPARKHYRDTVKA